MTYTRLLSVDDSSQVGEARRLAASMGRELGFDDVHVEYVSIVVSELATNLVKHAGGGDLVLRAVDDDVKFGIEVLSLDKGPGIENMGESLTVTLQKAVQETVWAQSSGCRPCLTSIRVLVWALPC